MAKQRNYQPGDPIEKFTVEDYNLLVDEVKNFIRPPVMSPLEMANGESISVSFQEGFYAKLIGNANPYSMMEQYGSAGGTWTKRVRTCMNCVYEVNNQTGLNGQIEWLTPGAPGEYLAQAIRVGSGSLPHPGPPCYSTITVLDACTMAAISGVSISIMNNTTVLCTGTTDGSGVYVCEPGVSGTLSYTASYDSCSYSGLITCNVPVTLYYCTGSVNYQAVDDTGADIGGVTFVAVALGGTVTSMTGGTVGKSCNQTSDGDPSRMTSSTPGTAVICWFQPTVPPTQPAGYDAFGTLVCPAVPCVIGYIYTCVPTTDCTPGSGAGDGTGIYQDANHYSSYGIYSNTLVICNMTTNHNPIFYRRSMWLYAPWSAGCSIDCAYILGVIDHNTSKLPYIPKKLYVTITGPTGILGTDSGVSIELDWVTGTWDGTNCTKYNSFGNSVPMRFQSSCRGGNGSGGYCATDPATCVQSIFVPYNSAQVIFEIQYFGGTGGGDFARLFYTNYWNNGCPSPDPSCACYNPGARIPGCPADYSDPDTTHYCNGSHYNPLIGGYYCFGFQSYPKSITIGMNCQAAIDTHQVYPGCSSPLFLCCTPLDLVSVPNLYDPSNCNYLAPCSNPYDPSYGQAVTAIITE